MKEHGVRFPTGISLTSNKLQMIYYVLLEQIIYIDNIVYNVYIQYISAYIQK